MKASEVNRDLFANKRSYEAALLGLELTNKLKELLAQGYWVHMNYEFKNNPAITIVQTDEDFRISIDRTLFVGDETTMPDEGPSKVWCTKKNVRAFFKRIMIIHPKYFIKLQSA